MEHFDLARFHRIAGSRQFAPDLIGPLKNPNGLHSSLEIVCQFFIEFLLPIACGDHFDHEGRAAVSHELVGKFEWADFGKNRDRRNQNRIRITPNENPQLEAAGTRPLGVMSIMGKLLRKIQDVVSVRFFGRRILDDGSLDQFAPPATFDEVEPLRFEFFGSQHSHDTRLPRSIGVFLEFTVESTAGHVEHSGGLGLVATGAFEGVEQH